MPPMSQAMALLTSQNTQEWYTPPWVIELARDIMGGIDLDPASAPYPQTWIKARTYHSLVLPPGFDSSLYPDEKSRNAYLSRLSLEQMRQAVWRGRVWLNPPFAHSREWAEKLCMERARHGRVTDACLLVNSALGYEWYETLWASFPALHFRKRLEFLNEDGQTVGQAKKAQTLFYFGDDFERFEALARPYGRVLLP